MNTFSADPQSLALPPWEQQLDLALNTLPPNLQRLLKLFYGKDFTAKEIQKVAPILGLPEISDEPLYPLFGSLLELVQRYLQELENAVRSQQKLLPELPPTLPGFEIAVQYLPKMGVSGDYYDFLDVGEKQLGVALGDVCGKGMGAAILMASVRAALRAQVEADPQAVGELLAHLNQTVARDAPERQFVTLAYGRLDANSYTFTYSLAGYPPVLHYQAETGHARELSTGGGVLGIWQGVEYPVDTVSLKVGDALVLHTDGIIEARDDEESEFGIDRLRTVLQTHTRETASALLEAILSAVSQFANENFSDDITVMVVKRNS
jgi:phosphoserine phosphatase RsbU/P